MAVLHVGTAKQKEKRVICKSDVSIHSIVQLLHVGCGDNMLNSVRIRV